MTEEQHILPAVAAVIFNERGETLLQKRRDSGTWGLISGHVEFGEDVEKAMLREIYEETGARAELVRFIGIYSSPSSQTYRYPGRIVQYVTTFFEARLCSVIPQGFNNDETSELRFFNTDEIPTDLALVNPNWLCDALDKKGTVFIR